MGGIEKGSRAKGSSSCLQLVEVEGNVGMASESLRMVLVDGSSVDCMGFKGKEIVVEEVITYSEERQPWFEGEEVEGWEKEFFDRLATVSRFLGMSTEGYEEEIMVMLKRIKACKGLKGMSVIERKAHLDLHSLKESRRNWNGR